MHIVCLGLLCGHFAINCWLLQREQILDLKPLKILDLDNDVSQQPGLPVFVGIMTATKYLNSRGCSAWKSWASHLGTQFNFLSFKDE